MVFVEGLFMYFFYGVGYVIVVGVCVIMLKVFFNGVNYFYVLKNGESISVDD